MDDSVGFEFIEGLMKKLSEELEASLCSDRWRARLLLRFAAQLVVCGVLEPNSLWKILEAVVDAANNVIEGKDGELYQPFSDYLVVVALSTLPFGGPEFLESDPKRLRELVARSNLYCTNRPKQFDAALKPFAAAIRDDDKLSQ